MNIQMIPLNKLTPSADNVRKTGGTSIDDLAASIAAHGLLQNLQVKPAAKGKFEVVAGGRRLRALNLLAKQKAIAKTFEVACNLADHADATEVSLAENIIREAMHPADQFDAFKAMETNGLSIEDIAARFGCPVSIVKQRLKLGSVHPSLIEAYREGQMQLEQLMAFTVSDDADAQMKVWESLPEWHRHADQIRGALMEGHVDANDRRVRFVGLDTYVAAGGPILRDLFDEENEGYLTDEGLLNRLVTARLEKEADALRAEGWKWVEIQAEFDPNRFRAFEEVEGTEVPYTEDEEAELARIERELDALDEAEQNTDEDYERIEKLTEQRDALTERPHVWTAEQMATAGAIVSRSRSELFVHKGLIPLSEVEQPVRDAATPKEKGAAAVSAKLVEELTAHRTAAMQVTLAGNIPVAIAALAETLARQMFYHGGETCVSVRAGRIDATRHGETLGHSKAVTGFESVMAEWKDRLPEDSESLADWLAAQDMDTCLALIAVCTAATVNATQLAHNRETEPRLGHARALASRLGLDMAAWWEPTASTYFSRVGKSLILDAVTEAKSKQCADNIASMKKPAMAAHAAELLEGSRWLPPVLRPAA